MDDREKKTEKRELPVQLNDAEIKKYAKALVKLEKDIKGVEDEKAVANAGFKERIAALDEKAAKLRDFIDSGTEPRKVEVEVCRDYRAAEITVTRLDTQEVIDRRNMTADEKQRGLFGDAGKPKGQGKDEAAATDPDPLKASVGEVDGANKAKKGKGKGKKAAAEKEPAT